MQPKEVWHKMHWFICCLKAPYLSVLLFIGWTVCLFRQLHIQRKLRSCYSPWCLSPHFGTAWHGDWIRKQDLACTCRCYELWPKLKALSWEPSGNFKKRERILPSWKSYLFFGWWVKWKNVWQGQFYNRC